MEQKEAVLILIALLMVLLKSKTYKITNQSLKSKTYEAISY